MSYRARCAARRARTMKQATKVRLGLEPPPKPLTPAEFSAVLKRSYPQHKIRSFTLDLVKPLWARIAYSRGWMSREAFEAVEDSLRVLSPFWSLRIGADKEPRPEGAIPWEECAAQDAKYPT